LQLFGFLLKGLFNQINMKKENTIAELLERLNTEIQNPKDSVHKIVLQTTIDNINKLME